MIASWRCSAGVIDRTTSSSRSTAPDDRRMNATGMRWPIASTIGAHRSSALRTMRRRTPWTRVMSPIGKIVSLIDAWRMSKSDGPSRKTAESSTS
jgi:hypothetical protein